MRIILALLSVAFFGNAAEPPKFSNDLTKWQEQVAPKQKTKEYGAIVDTIGWSKNEWAVILESGKVRVKFCDENPTGEVPVFLKGDKTGVKNSKFQLVCSMKVEGGWLVGYNGGEWGGSIVWYSSNGKEKKSVSDHHIHQFVQTKEGISGAEGLSHLGGDYGSVIRIFQEKEVWVAKTFAELPAAGRAVVSLPENELGVLTNTAILRVSETGKVETLIGDLKWGQCYPNSMVVSDGVFYVGMRRYVAAFDSKKKEDQLKFLYPSKEYLQAEK